MWKLQHKINGTWTIVGPVYSRFEMVNQAVETARRGGIEARAVFACKGR